MRLFKNIAEVRRKLEIDYFLERRIRKTFYRKMGYRLHLESPCTFSEKIQWMKLYYRNPLMTRCADKHLARTCVKEMGGEEYLTKLYGIYNSSREIDLSKLPDKFVLKPNHSCGKIIICNGNKASLNWKDNFKLLDDSLKRNYFYVNGEWQYKNMKPKIVCEQFLGENMTDYKFFCFHGKPFMCNVIGNRDRKTESIDECFVDLDYHVLPILQNGRHHEFPKPTNWTGLVEAAQKLCGSFAFVRVDLYHVDGKIYFGELTFCPADGMEKWEPLEWDYRLGEMIHLDELPSQMVIR